MIFYIGHACVTRAFLAKDTRIRIEIDDFPFSLRATWKSLTRTNVEVRFTHELVRCLGFVSHAVRAVGFNSFMSYYGSRLKVNTYQRRCQGHYRTELVT